MFIVLIEHFKKAILLCLFFIISCSANDKSDGLEMAGALQAQPESFISGEEILLSFPQHHPENIAIRIPSGVWYSIHSAEDSIQILSAEKYTVATRLLLDTENLVGVAWVNGVKVGAKVFRELGEYLIYMANNLETEPDNTFHFMVKVTMQNK